MENIHSCFKKELGYICATNQYLELAIRVLECEHKENIENNLQDFARNYRLNVSVLPEMYSLRICKSYIVNIYSVFEKFLKNFAELAGSPTNVSEIKRKKDESYLEWTMNIVKSDDNSGVKEDYRICNYYRLIRNKIVHSGTMDNESRMALSIIKNNSSDKLNAPNVLDNLTFDDQVLFSRAASNLVNYIFKSSTYSIDRIIDVNKKDILNILKKFKEKSSHNRAISSLKQFIYRQYPDMPNVQWERIVEKLLE